MSGRFDGKVAFITGATSGIGRATALAFGREGEAGSQRRPDLVGKNLGP